jgi:hypothetical protein
MSRPKEVAQVACGSTEAMLEVGEEKTDGVTNTMHGHGGPCRGRRRSDSLRCPCVGTVKMTACSDATPRKAGRAAGCESVQRHDH